MHDRETELHRAVERFGDLVFARDFAVADEFDPDAVFIGSEADETARGMAELRDRFKTIFAGAHDIRFIWDTLDVARAGDVGWFSAFGHAVIGSGEAARRLPYRLTGVLLWRDGAWRWQQFHGSEPAG